MYRSIKHYPHSLGLSACFRQWRAESHCAFLHGYALAFTLTFECHDEQLDIRNWCTDFGGLKPIKQWLGDTFDHQTLVAEDDPEIEVFFALARQGLIQLQVVDRVGCEAFAKMVYDYTADKLNTGQLDRQGDFVRGRVRLVSVECSEHEGNSAIYVGGI